MARKAIEAPKFKSESEEADWWASAAGHEFLSRKSRALEEKGIAPAGSRLVAELSKKSGPPNAERQLLLEGGPLQRRRQERQKANGRR
jgi:hypothetical protein